MQGTFYLGRGTDLSIGRREYVVNWGERSELQWIREKSCRRVIANIFNWVDLGLNFNEIIFIRWQIIVLLSDTVSKTGFCKLNYLI